MTSILLGFAIIAAGVLLAQLFRRWARSDADGRKKMSDRDFNKPQPVRTAATAQVTDAASKFGKRPQAREFGRR
jgi:hypothetical protein